LWKINWKDNYNTIERVLIEYVDIICITYRKNI
jgi:hypothetical protein